MTILILVLFHIFSDVCRRATKKGASMWILWERVYRQLETTESS